MAMGLDEDYVSVIVWVLRIVLPIVLLVVTFGPKVDWTRWRFVYSREALLAYRRGLLASGSLGDAVGPYRLARAVPSKSLPNAFQESTENEQRDDIDRREADRRDRGDGRSESSLSSRHSKQPKRSPDTEPVIPPLQEQGGEEEGPLSTAQRMHTESLVNFVAFNRGESQRCFLLRQGVKPPAPPVQTRQPEERVRVTGAAALRANHEAQMVLLGVRQAASRGAIVARGLHDQLHNLDIEISDKTYELMVQASVKASDLKTSTMLLTRMENAGKKPSSALFDCVMDLHMQEGPTHSYTEREFILQEGEVEDSSAPAKLQLSAPPVHQSQMWPDDQQEMTSLAGGAPQHLLHHEWTAPYDQGRCFRSQDVGERRLDGGTAFAVPHEFMARPSESESTTQPTDGQPTDVSEAARAAQPGETESNTGADEDWQPHEDLGWSYHLQEGVHSGAEWPQTEWEWHEGKGAGHIGAADRPGEGWGDHPHELWADTADEVWESHPQHVWQGRVDEGWHGRPHRPIGDWPEDRPHRPIGEWPEDRDYWHATRDFSYPLSRQADHRWTPHPRRPPEQSWPPVRKEKTSQQPWWQQTGSSRAQPWPEVRKMVWKAKD